MASYREMVQKYRKRRHDTVIDTVTTGLSVAGDVSVDLGLLDDTGITNELLDTATGLLPFAVIALTEEYKVLMGKKSGAAGTSDAIFRMIKTGTAMGVGAVTLAAGAGAAVALPAAMGVRVLLDRYRSHAMTGRRVSLRTQRLKMLHKPAVSAAEGTATEA